MVTYVDELLLQLKLCRDQINHGTFAVRPNGTVSTTAAAVADGQNRTGALGSSLLNGSVLMLEAPKVAVIAAVPAGANIDAPAD